MRCCETIWMDETGAERRFYVYGMSVDDYVRHGWKQCDHHVSKGWRFVDVRKIPEDYRKEEERGQGRTRVAAQPQQHFFDPYLARLGAVSRGADPDTLFAPDESRRDRGLGQGAFV